MITSLKCGIIILIDNKDFEFVCSLCGNRYKNPTSYFIHVLDFHKLKVSTELKAKLNKVSAFLDMLEQEVQ